MVTGHIYTNGSSVGPDKYNRNYHGGTGGNGLKVFHSYGSTPVISRSLVQNTHKYTIKVIENGLAPSQFWQVILFGKNIGTPESLEANSNSIDFQVFDGNYIVHTSNVSGYYSSFINDSVSVSNGPVQLSVTFTQMNIFQILGMKFIYSFLIGSALIVVAAGVMIYMKPNRGGR